MRLQRAYLDMSAGDLAVGKNNVAGANAEYNDARKSAPHLVENPFWCAVTLVNGSKVDEALPIFKAFSKARQYGLI